MQLPANSNIRVIKVFQDRCVEEIYQIHQPINTKFRYQYVEYILENFPHTLITTAELKSSYLEEKYELEKKRINQSILEYKQKLGELAQNIANESNEYNELYTTNGNHPASNHSISHQIQDVKYWQIYPRNKGQSYNEYIFSLMENWKLTFIQSQDLDELYQLESKLQSIFWDKMRKTQYDSKEKWKTLLLGLNQDLISKTIAEFESSKSEDCPVERCTNDIEDPDFCHCRKIKFEYSFELGELENDIGKLEHLSDYFTKKEKPIYDFIANDSEFCELRSKLFQKYDGFSDKLARISESDNDEMKYALINEYIEIKRILYKDLRDRIISLGQKWVNSDSCEFDDLIPYNGDIDSYSIMDKDHKSYLIDINTSLGIHKTFKFKAFNCCVCNLLEPNLLCYFNCGKDRGISPSDLLELKGISFAQPKHKTSFISELEKEMKKEEEYDPHEFMEYPITNTGKKKYICEDGHIVDFELERVVDNFLHQKQIPHHVAYNYHRKDIPFYGFYSRPNFVLKDCYIEIAGLKDWKLSNYKKKINAQKIQNKEITSQNLGINLIVLTPKYKNFEMSGNYRPDYILPLLKIEITSQKKVGKN